jgi:hypothetical protein
MTSDDEQLLFALYEFENARPRVLSYLERTYEDPAVQHCIDQAKHHLKLVHELLEGAVLNPQTHYDDARTFYQTLWKVHTNEFRMWVFSMRQKVVPIIKDLWGSL